MAHLSRTSTNSGSLLEANCLLISINAGQTLMQLSIIQYVMSNRLSSCTVHCFNFVPSSLKEGVSMANEGSHFASLLEYIGREVLQHLRSVPEALLNQPLTLPET